MKIRMIILLIIVSMITGCVGVGSATKVKKEAFVKPKKLAIVKFGGYIDEQWASALSGKKQIINEVADAAFKELNKSKRIKLLPQNIVLSNARYKAIKDYDKDPLHISAFGYKYFDYRVEKANLRALAKELSVDGFIYVTVGYGAKTLGSRGVTPSMTLMVAATDADGVIIWQDTSTRYNVGHVELTQSAIEKIINKLDNRLR